MYSHVKGVDMIIIQKVWTAEAGLKNTGRTVGKGNTNSLENFNKIQFFRSYLRNPHAAMRGYHVGGLSINPRILAFIVIWLLTPGGYNHVLLTEENLILMYCIMHRYKINRINVIKEHMSKTRKVADYRIPYVVLVSKFLEHFEVDLEDELTEMVKPHIEITCATLHRIGLKKVNDEYWIYKAEEEGDGQQGNEDVDAGQEGDGVGPSGTTAGNYAMVPYVPPIDKGEPLSWFEHMVIDRLDTMAHDQRDHHEFCTARFQHLDGQIEGIQE